MSAISWLQWLAVGLCLGLLAVILGVGALYWLLVLVALVVGYMKPRLMFAAVLAGFIVAPSPWVSDKLVPGVELIGYQGGLTALDLVMAAAALGAVFRVHRLPGTMSRRRSLLVWPVWLLAMSFLFLYWGAPALTVAWPAVLRIVAAFLLAYEAYNSPPDGVPWLEAAVVSSAALLVLLSLSPQYASHRADAFIGSRYRAPGYAANEFSIVLAAAVVFAMELLAKAKKQLARVAALIGMAVVLVGLVLTGSRNGLVSAAVAFLVYRFKSKGVRPGLYIAAGLAVVAVLGVLPSVATQMAYFDSSMSLVQRLLNPSAANGSVDSFRLQIWGELWRYWQALPLEQRLVGAGPYGYQAVAPPYLVTVFHAIHAHNWFLNWLIEWGVVGCSLALAALGYVIARAWRSAPARLSPAILGGLMAFVASGFFDYVIRYDKGQVVLASMIGVVFALTELKTRAPAQQVSVSQ